MNTPDQHNSQHTPSLDEIAHHLDDLLYMKVRIDVFNRQRQAFLALPWYLRVWRALKKEL